jgi:exonuclease VII large subunit
MAMNADVRSLESLELFLAQLETFRAKLLGELENAEVEVRRLTAWLEQDVQAYWMDELKSAQRNYAEAASTLSRCMSYVRSDEKRPCTEEKKRVQKTKLRRETCEQKLQIARAAAVQWERERTKNQSRVERCRDMCESDLLVAINHLRGQIEQLARYTSLRSAALADASKKPGDPSEGANQGRVESPHTQDPSGQDPS